MLDALVHTALVGGNLLFREGLRQILADSGYAIDLIASSLDDALRYPSPVDLFVLLEFPDSDPKFLAAVGAARSSRPDARIVAIAEDRPTQGIAVLKAGLHGYLARHISVEALPRFLSLIMRGQRIFSMQTLNLQMDLPDLMPKGAPSQETLAERIDERALTERERELLKLLVEGGSNKAIAKNLGIAEATVKTQMTRLFDKIGAANRTQAAVLAWTSQRNLIPPQRSSPKRSDPVGSTERGPDAATHSALIRGSVEVMADHERRYQANADRSPECSEAKAFREQARAPRLRQLTASV